MMETKLTKEYARQKDAERNLLAFRKEFHYPVYKSYMDTHTLGLMPVSAQKGIEQALQEWQKYASNSWTQLQDPWLAMAENVGAKMSELMGAHPKEVVATGTLSSNLISMLTTFYKPIDNRCKILTIDQISVSHIYTIHSYLQLQGLDPFENLVVINTQNEFISEKEIISQISDEVILLILPSASKINGQLFNLSYLSNQAHDKQIIIGFDFSDTAGAIPHTISESDIDFGFWTASKYLYGGPGASAFLYINKNHFGRLPGITGWFGNKNETKFEYSLNFDPAEGAKAWQTSAPNILNLYTIDKALDVILEAGIQNIRQESLQLTGYFIWLCHSVLSMSPMNFRLLTPERIDQRGAHIAIQHIAAHKIFKAMLKKGFSFEYRKPDILRFSPNALYNTYEELLELVLALKEVMERREFEKY